MMLNWNDSDTESDAGTTCVTDTPASLVGELETTSPIGGNGPRASREDGSIVPFIGEEQRHTSGDGIGEVICLELHNFKSYRETVRISNFSKFTAIVGPNGCGKSNVMDAISFVLCVHSSVLRGMNLKDFIYKSRQSEAPATEAYVSLTLKGTKKPVQFKRKIYASGSVSYHIDEETISFKRYKEALREYRINTLGSTGLIFQGAVNDIASCTPMELTKLFETISGSSLYARPYNYIKEKLERRRMEYRDLLSRKKALQQEIREYRSLLSSDTNYDDLLAKYKQQESKKYACELRVLEIKFRQHLEEYDKLINRNEKLDERWSSMQVKRDELENNRSGLYFEQGQLHRAIQDKRKQLASKQESMRNYYETESSLQREIEEVGNLRRCLEADLARLHKEHEDLSHEETELRKAVDADSKQIKKLKYCSVKLTASQQLRYEELLQSFNKATASMRIKMNLCSGRINAISSEHDYVQGELESLNKYLGKIRESARSHATMQEGLSTKLRETKDSIELHIMTKSRLQHERNQLQSRKAAMQAEKDELDGHLKTLNVAKVEYRQILRRRQYTQELVRDIPGVHGEVISLCEITNACYHDGIMAALNTRSHMIVTENLATIQACIERLQKDKVCKRDFFPLDSITQGRSHNRSKITEFVRSHGLTVPYTFAIDCLVFQRKYASLFEHLLGDTIIVQNLDDAERFISVDRGSLLSFSVVTQKGQVIMRDRTIIIDSAIYSKKSQIELEIAELSRLTLKSERLEHDLHSLTKKLATAETSLQDTINKIQKLQRAVELLQMKVDFALKHKEGSESQVRATEDKVRSLSSAMSKLETELDVQKIEQERDQIILDSLQQSHFDELNIELGVEDVYAIFSCRSENVLRIVAQQERRRALLGRCRNDKEEIQKQMEHIKTASLPDAVERYQNSVSKLQELRNENQSLFREIGTLERDLDANQERFDEFSRRIEDCHERIRLLQYEYHYEAGTLEDEGTKSDGMNNRVVPICELKEKITTKIMGLVTTMKGLQKQAIDLSEDCRLKNVDIVISVPQLLLEAQETGFKPEFPTVEASLIEGIGNSIGEIERCISTLDTEMQCLRKSLSASRACDDASTRMQRAQVDSDHLDNELAATKTECNSLEADFDRIKKERTGLFMHCFQNVKRLVGPIYRSLSAQDENDEMSGGSAFLSLDDDLSGSVSEPFLCSIRYNTMPPMKKFMDISLQSGGEKALSSLALLLALHSFRKSPFVVLDEIDANLDNTKVESLVSFLQRSDFQVIVISLKPKLFSRADVLVGIYSKQETRSSNCVVLSLCDIEQMSSPQQEIEQYI